MARNASRQKPTSDRHRGSLLMRLLPCPRLETPPFQGSRYLEKRDTSQTGSTSSRLEAIPRPRTMTRTRAGSEDLTTAPTRKKNKSKKTAVLFPRPFAIRLQVLCMLEGYPLGLGTELFSSCAYTLANLDECTGHHTVGRTARISETIKWYRYDIK